MKSYTQKIYNDSLSGNSTAQLMCFGLGKRAELFIIFRSQEIFYDEAWNTRSQPGVGR